MRLSETPSALILDVYAANRRAARGVARGLRLVPSSRGNWPNGLHRRENPVARFRPGPGRLDGELVPHGRIESVEIHKVLYM